jgi:hypothetical protein
MSVIPCLLHPRWPLLALLSLLAACAARAPLPQIEPDLALPLQLHLQGEVEGQPQDWLLVIQREGQALRWSLFDPLGVPLARQRLQDGEWQADGLLPPNPHARELFAALLFALTPQGQLQRAYPQQVQSDPPGRRLQQGGQVRWQVETRTAEGFDLLLGSQRYRVRRLESQR